MLMLMGSYKLVQHRYGLPMLRRMNSPVGSPWQAAGYKGRCFTNLWDLKI